MGFRSDLSCVALLGLVACASATEPTEPTSTFLSFVSDPMEYVGRGETHRYRFSDGAWFATYNPTGNGASGAQSLYVQVRPLDPMAFWDWNLRLAAPNGQVLAPGTYEGAVRFSVAGTEPILDFFGTGRGCNIVAGRFVIHALTLGPSNTLARLHVSFEQHCEGGSPKLTGEIAIIADPWR
jgi:hypothetical protein